MDYEKAYKAVLKTATQWIKDGCTDKEKICLECVFPQLRESEDERIRKEMIEFFQCSMYCDDLDTEKIKRWVTYLEKQQEQAPAWSEDDERMRNQLIYDVEQHKEKCLISAKQNKATKAFCDGVEECQDKKIAWLKSLRPSWKPSEEQMEALRYVAYKHGNSCLSPYSISNKTLASLYKDLKRL